MKSLAEAITEAEELKKKRNAVEIITLLTPFWEEKITINVGALLAYAYRREHNYDKCLEICDQVDQAANFPAKIKAQRQWCIVFRDIIDENNLDKAESAAIETISRLNVNNSYEFNLFSFICRSIAGRCVENDFNKGIEWYEKIPSVKLNNKTSLFTEEATGPSIILRSEKYNFYKMFVTYVIEKNRLFDYLNIIADGFNAKNKTDFIEAIIKAVSAVDYKGNSYIRKDKLANILMHIKESGHYRQHLTVKITDTLKMSDVAAFVFCPISAVISKTLLIQELSLEYNEHVAFSKKYINDHFEIIKNNKVIWEDAFQETLASNFNFSDSQKIILSRIFGSQKIAGNSQVGSYQLSNIFKGEDISFSPDMVLQDQSGKFCVEEVFTSSSADLMTKPYENDKIKLVGYLKELNINKGYLIYWNMHYIENDGNQFKKRAFITAMKIFEINLTQQLTDIYLDYNQKIKRLISFGSQPISGINYNKCVSCSVMHYCIHKFGNKTTLLYPYKLNYTD